MTNNFQSASASILLWMLTTAGASAQIIPDATLPNNTTATPNGNTIIIDEGTPRGTNLFHSFREFNLGNGSTAFFNNRTDIGNIISRVTGGNLSNIDGLIRANGSANLFFINPAGIVFGPNARLNIGGSFIGTTANSIIFDDGSFYSATNPNAPPLLTVNVPIGLQLGGPGEIRVAGNGNRGAFPEDGDGLAVSPGRTLALVGGDVTMRGGMVAAESGRIEIGSAARGEVSLTPVDVGWRLGYEKVGEFGEVSLSDRSSISNSSFNSNTNSFPTGGIQVQGRRVVLEERSRIASVTHGSQAGGDILINATEALEIGVASGIISQVEEGSSGNGGGIIVTAPQLRLFDGGRISSFSFGDGGGGNIEVNAGDIAIGGLAVGGGEIFNSGILSENHSAGSGGNIAVSTRQLNLLDGGILRSFVSPTATGNGGHINLFAADSVTAIGTPSSAPFDASSGIFSATEGNGRGGDLRLSTARLSLSQTASIGSQTEGRGKGGDISLEIADLISISSGGIASRAFGSSDGGAIAVSTQRLRLTDGGRVVSLVNIPTAGRSLPGADTANAGDVTVIAGDDLEAIGVNPEAPDNLSGVSSVTFADGKGGDVTIFARRLTVKDGATLSSTVIPGLSSMGEAQQGAGSGGGGDLRVNVSGLIVVSGVNPFIATPSNVGTLTFGDGNAGNTVVNVRRAIVEDGGLISSFTSAGGDAGKITINASESILVGGSDAVTGLSAEITADSFILDEEVQQVFIDTPLTTGNTGQLTINTNRLTVKNGARINVQHEGTGNAGTLEINAAEVFLENDASITAASASGRGGNITLKVPTSLQLRGGSRITAEAGGRGDGGNLSINAETIALLRNSNIDANAFQGNGGNIAITTKGLFLSPGSAITASSQLGVDGTVKIEQFGANPDEIIVDLRGDRLDASALVTVSCEDYQNSEFIVTGRGGLSPNPTLPLAINSPLVEWASPEESSRSGTQPQKQYIRDTDTPPLVEATGWIVDGRGKIILVADAPTATPTAPGLTHPGCR